MFSSPGRKKARPSTANLVWSALVFAAAIFLAWTFFSVISPRSFYVDVLFSLIGMGVIAALPSLYRLRGLKRGLPEPYGEGRVSIIDSKSASRAGYLLVIGGLLCIVLLFGSVFFIPVLDLFVIMFSLAGGLPLSQVVFFLMVFSIERAAGSRIFEVIDETTQDGASVLSKTFELSPDGRRPANPPL